jgi:hypothetical protein
MRNIFDQYSQPENRITHALLTAFNCDRSLLRLFLRDLVNIEPPNGARALKILEQQYPNEAEQKEDELERRGIPDGWIYDHEWCVFIESKVLAKFSLAQIIRHRRTAEQLNFRTIIPVAIAANIPNTFPRDHAVALEWRQIYKWLSKQSSEHRWAKRTAEYLEIAEEKMIEAGQYVEGTLTMFAGFPFGRDHPLRYLEAKRLLGLAMDELRKRRDLKNILQMEPKLSGRPAITGSQTDSVWDFLRISASAATKMHTEWPHLTLGLAPQQVEVMVTVPNSVNSRLRRDLARLGEDGFRDLVGEILGNMKALLKDQRDAVPWFRGVQRRFISRRSSLTDAQIDFDLRTAFPSKGPKTQPLWLSAAYGALTKKKGSNYQVQIGVLFKYDKCPAIRTLQAIDLVAKAWIACNPLLKLTR